MSLTERRTDRLLLRRVEETDLADFDALEAALRRAETPPAPQRSAAYLAMFLRAWDEGDLGYWTIRYQDRVVGFGGVQPKVWRGRECWNLYYRVHPDCQGLGIAGEVAREAIAAAAEVRPEWPVLVETRPENLPAIRVAERAGLVRLGPEENEEYATLLTPDR
jgi:RimJ/RimL family protein N-acetyltransferase